MSSKEKRTVPAEAIEIYNKYIHDEISRREFLRGVKKFAVAGLGAGALRRGGGKRGMDANRRLVQ